MKVFLVKGKYKIDNTRIKKQLAELIKSLIKSRIKSLGIYYTIQYQQAVKFVVEELKENFEIKGIKQITGCAVPLINAQAYLYVGDGNFHPLSIIKSQIDVAFLKNKNFDLLSQVKPLFIINEVRFEKIDKSLVEKQIKDLKARWFNFNQAKNYGIIVSVKPGQEAFDLAIKIKDRIEKKGKKAFLFLANEIDLNQFINFNIDFWIITACPQFSVEGHKKLCNSTEFFIFDKLLGNENNVKNNVLFR